MLILSTPNRNPYHAATARVSGIRSILDIGGSGLAHVVPDDRVVAHRARERRHVLRCQVGCAEHRHVLVDVGDDLVDLLR